MAFYELNISLEAITANWTILQTKIGNSECSAVIKADAYGCGMAPVATALLKAGCHTFFVAHLSEGIALRELCSTATIYILNGMLPGDGSTYTKHNLRPVIGSESELAEWTRHASSHAFALQVDTGINRLGVKPQNLSQFRNFKPQLLMSHFIASEVHDDKRNRQQIERFENARSVFPTVNASLANSSGIFLKEMPFYDLVRPGYALYGGNPTPSAPNPMQNVISLTAPVIQTSKIAQGETVGYNGIWTAQRDSLIATLSIGYADGFLRSASSMNDDGGQIAWSGALYPVVGRVSMDLVTVDVTDAQTPPLRGDKVEIIGNTLPIDAVASRLKTIGYEVMTSLGKRHSKIYI